jgi:hypothetical protein
VSNGEWFSEGLSLRPRQGPLLSGSICAMSLVEPFSLSLSLEFLPWEPFSESHAPSVSPSRVSFFSVSLWRIFESAFRFCLFAFLSESLSSSAALSQSAFSSLPHSFSSDRLSCFSSCRLDLPTGVSLLRASPFVAECLNLIFGVILS